MRKQLNYTCMLKNLLKLYCIWTWDTLWCFLFGLVWIGFFSPIMRQWQNYFWDTISRIAVWDTNTKIIKTETLLHLNIKIFLYIFFFSILWLSNVCSAYGWLVHYLSLFISLKFLFVHLFWVFLFVHLFFPLSLTSLLWSPLTLPF
jgi:hypothetical protein